MPNFTGENSSSGSTVFVRSDTSVVLDAPSVQVVANGQTLGFTSTGANILVVPNTTDGADNETFEINGGGGTGDSRGASLIVAGNEAASIAGSAILSGGNVATGNVILEPGNASAQVIFRNAAGTTNATISNAGSLVLNNGSLALLGNNQAITVPINGVTAAGTILGDSTQLTTATSVVVTAAAGSGVRLFDNGNFGTFTFVVNRAANAVNVYPPTGSGTINGGAAGAAVAVAVGAVAIFFHQAANTWVAGEMPAA